MSSKAKLKLKPGFFLYSGRIHRLGGGATYYDPPPHRAYTCRGRGRSLRRPTSALEVRPKTFPRRQVIPTKDAVRDLAPTRTLPSSPERNRPRQCVVHTACSVCVMRSTRRFLQPSVHGRSVARAIVLADSDPSATEIRLRARRHAWTVGECRKTSQTARR